MIKKYYSPSQVIKLSNDDLDFEDLRDLCFRGVLTPCIYFEGNLVCLSSQRYQMSSNGPVAHMQEVIWTHRFKGYIHFKKLADYLDPSYNQLADPFFEVDKVVEYISEPENYAQRIPIPINQILKAFPRQIDDDIREIRWLVEDMSFQGNHFEPRNIKFPREEVEQLLTPPPEVKLEIPSKKSDLINAIEKFERRIGLKTNNYNLPDFIANQIQDEETNSIVDTNLDHDEPKEQIQSEMNNLLTSYTTPALEALRGVIVNFWIDFDPTRDIPPKQITVIDWIKENYPEVQANDICTYIDKICRHKNAKRGGNTKRKS